jgi:tripartite ATP-independent transporter DctM subunit
MMVLPLAEALLRRIGSTGVSGGSALLQHLTLVAGMLGGAYAAREARLLALSPLTALLKGGWVETARCIAYGVGAAVSLVLTWGAWQFIQTEREASKLLAYGIPVWLVQCVMPLGFALIALRLIWTSSPRWSARASTAVVAAIGCALAWWPPVAPASMTTPLLLVLLVATLLGAPVFVTIGGAAAILFWGAETPIASISLTHYSLVTNPTLPALPLFTLAGYWLAEGGASARLVRVFRALLGSLRGGPALLTACVCAFFTSFTGASGVTILALGGLLMPVLLGSGMAPRPALGLLTASGSLGLLFPPCLPVLLYAVVANQNSAAGGLTMQKLFLGGALPGLVLLLLTAWWGARYAPLEQQRARVDWNEVWSAVREAKWELLLPVVTLTALFGGFATAVEAAALTALYAFVVETFVYRDLSITRDTPRVMGECGLVVGGVLLILGVALGFTNYLVDAQVAIKTVDWATATIESKYVFLLALNLALLVVGCLMDIYSAIVVVVPLLVPLGEAYGIDPVHLGIVFLLNLELGYLTPPVGMNLFLSSYRFNKPMPEVARATFPMLVVMTLGVLALTYMPFLTTGIVSLFYD